MIPAAVMDDPEQSVGRPGAVIEQVEREGPGGHSANRRGCRICTPANRYGTDLVVGAAARPAIGIEIEIAVTFIAEGAGRRLQQQQRVHAVVVPGGRQPRQGAAGAIAPDDVGIADIERRGCPEWSKAWATPPPVSSNCGSGEKAMSARWRRWRADLLAQPMGVDDLVAARRRRRDGRGRDPAWCVRPPPPAAWAAVRVSGRMRRPSRRQEPSRGWERRSWLRYSPLVRRQVAVEPGLESGQLRMAGACSSSRHRRGICRR